MDDLIRKHVINQLICQFTLDLTEVERKFSIRFDDYFATEMQALQPLAADGLVVLRPSDITVTNAGRLLIRTVCMIFDAYLNKSAHNPAARYSRII